LPIKLRQPSRNLEFRLRIFNPTISQDLTI
jgi:hypothetical protein